MTRAVSYLQTLQFADMCPWRHFLRDRTVGHGAQSSLERSGSGVEGHESDFQKKKRKKELNAIFQIGLSAQRPGPPNRSA